MSTPAGISQNKSLSIAVIGGGLAGIAAAEFAARRGCRVTLFERSRVLGGRAASIFDPVAEQWIDNGQHLVMGCCTELLELHKRLGLDQFFRCHRTIPFAQWGGKRWTLAPSPFLPHSLQLLPALLKTPFLSVGERLKLIGQIRKLCAGVKTEGRNSFADWLQTQNTPQNTIDHFWNPLVFSSLSETLDHVCCEAVRKVVQDGFLAGRNAMTVQLPATSLRRIYNDAVLEKLRSLGVNVRLLARIRRLEWGYASDSAPVPHLATVETVDGVSHRFDAYLLAIPAPRLWEILDASQLGNYVEQLGLDRFEPGAITTAHLWFDRKILPKEQAYCALLDGPGQFFACPNDNASAANPASRHSPLGVYHTVVISASHRLLSDSELTPAGSEALLDRLLEQLRNTFPAAFSETTLPETTQKGAAKLLHHRITTYFDAVFSPCGTIYSNRPEQATPFSNLALAGDWTQTDWPATMEGAVRSGLRAVDALLGTVKNDP